MRVAVLGVGLIGGSIGLAARRRLGAEVAGFDAEHTTLERAIEREALDQACASAGEAVAGAEVVFCAAPVGALPGLVAEALRASADDALVTDVGSTKLGLLAGLPRDSDRERFIGGPPLGRGAASGNEAARAAIFERAA